MLAKTWRRVKVKAHNRGYLTLTVDKNEISGTIGHNRRAEIRRQRGRRYLPLYRETVDLFPTARWSVSGRALGSEPDRNS